MSLKAIILKILNSKIKFEDVVEKAQKKIGTIIGQSKALSPLKTDKTHIESEQSKTTGSKFDRIRKKKGFLLAGQILGKATEDAARDQAAKAFTDYEKSKNGNILVLLGYLRKVPHQVVDESDFLKNHLTEILENEGGIAKQHLLFKFYVEIGYYD